jgi:hypothetical protein
VSFYATSCHLIIANNPIALPNRRRIVFFIYNGKAGFVFVYPIIYINSKLQDPKEKEATGSFPKL